MNDNKTFDKQQSFWRKKPVTVEAHQWFRNGDHPEDGNHGEGKIVRYYRHPNVSGSKQCSQCGFTMDSHGWIDTLEGGHNVCPGDWIITGVKGEHYPCKPDIFAATYEPVGDAPSYPWHPTESDKVPLSARGERVLFSDDAYCPGCGHNRGKSTISTIELLDGHHECQICGALWSEVERSTNT